MDIITQINKYTDKEYSMDEEKQFEKALYRNPGFMDEYQLHLHLNNYMKGKFMVEHAEKDDFYTDAAQFAQKAISIHKSNESKNNEILDFLNTAKNENEGSLDEKIKFAETEAYENNINRLTNNWVNDWKKEEKDIDYLKGLKSFVANGMAQNQEKKQHEPKLKIVKKQETSDKYKYLNKWFYLAASIAAIFIISINLWDYIYSPVSNSELFASYYQPYDLASSQTRSSDTETETKFQKASNLYEAEDYTEALKLFNKVLSADSEHVKARFLYGLTQLETRNYKSAAEEFNLVIQLNGSYNIDARWYLALCYIKLEKTEKAVQLLKELSLIKNYYQKQATEILSEISPKNGVGHD